MSRKLVVMVGAGASYDCFEDGVATANGSYRPPLVKDLFENTTAFSEILSRYQKAQTISGDIRSRLLNDDDSLENILVEYSKYDKKTANYKCFLEVPFYLQELFLNISLKYIQSGANNYQRLVVALDSSDFDEIMFVTTNYDLFLEQAFMDSGIFTNTFENVGQYKNLGQKFSLVKLHGSVNWGRKLKSGGRGLSPKEGLLSVYSPASLSDEITVLNWNNMTNAILPHVNSSQASSSLRMHNGDFCYPAIGMPLANKSDFICESNMVDFAKDFCEECEDFLFIGFSGADKHILSELFSAVDGDGKLNVVNENKVGADALYEKLTDEKCFGGFRYIPYDCTFTEFIKDVLADFCSG